MNGGQARGLVARKHGLAQQEHQVVPQLGPLPLQRQQRGEHRCVTGSLRTEAEVVAHDDGICGDRRILAQESCEFLRGARRQLGRKRQDYDLVGTGLAQEHRPALRRC